MSTPAKPRPRPCASCPFRTAVPSGIWSTEEYLKLPEYDRPTPEQPAEVFMCHQQDGCVCSGWLGREESRHLLAVRLGVAMGSLDQSCLDYRTDVPLFPTCTEAAEHGMAEVDDPSAQARALVEKIEASRRARLGTPDEALRN